MGEPKRSSVFAKRQEELSQCRIIVPDIEKGIYPFKGIKLSRADVKWLLATHENGYGSVDWRDENQRKSEELDLCGADLSDGVLSGLSLARMRGGLSVDETNTYEYPDIAAIHYTAKSKVRKK